MKEQIDALVQLQKLDTALETIKAQRGTLPDRIERLQAEINRLNSKLKNITSFVAEQEQIYAAQQEEKKNAEALLKTYKEEQLLVSESLAHESIQKEILLQEIRIQLAQKKSKIAIQTGAESKEEIAALKEQIKAQKAKVEQAQGELNTILQKNEKEEAKLLRSRRAFEEPIDKELLGFYERMRAYVKPPLVVTSVENGVCLGCCVEVPPSEQILVREQKRLVHCQHCYRILASVATA